MSFDVEAVRPPNAVRVLNIALTVRDRIPGPGRDYGGAYDFHVLDADGQSLSHRTGNLVPHLTPSQTTALRNFLDAMFDKAKATVST